MVGDRRSKARFESDLFRNYYYKLLKFLIFESVIILLLTVGIIYFVFFQPLHKYYATTANGQIIPMKAMRQ
jgi:hypothetical protein